MERRDSPRRWHPTGDLTSDAGDESRGVMRKAMWRGENATDIGRSSLIWWSLVSAARPVSAQSEGMARRAARLNRIPTRHREPLVTQGNNERRKGESQRKSERKAKATRLTRSPRGSAPHRSPPCTPIPRLKSPDDIGHRRHRRPRRHPRRSYAWCGDRFRGTRLHPSPTHL